MKTIMFLTDGGCAYYTRPDDIRAVEDTADGCLVYMLYGAQVFSVKSREPAVDVRARWMEAS